MINITDDKGRKLGLDYDYEYRGSRHEKYRDMPYYKSTLLWFVLFAVFVFAGIFLLIKDSGENLLAALVSFAISALFVWVWLSGKKKHQQLLHAISFPHSPHSSHSH